MLAKIDVNNDFFKNICFSHESVFIHMVNWIVLMFMRGHHSILYLHVQWKYTLSQSMCGADIRTIASLIDSLLASLPMMVSWTCYKSWLCHNWNIWNEASFSIRMGTTSLVPKFHQFLDEKFLNRWNGHDSLIRWPSDYTRLLHMEFYKILGVPNPRLQTYRTWRHAFSMHLNIEFQTRMRITS